MALDEPSTRLIAEFAAAGAKPIHESTPAEAREAMSALPDLYGPGPEMASAFDEAIPTGDGSTVTTRVFVPADEPSAVIVYYHGGGWVIGALAEFDTLARDLAQRTGAAVVLVDYRLAPEHPYPTPVEDAWAALEWAAGRLEDLAGRHVPLIVAGDSAGATLATVVARRAVAKSAPEIALQILVYPVCDADVGTGSYRDPENQLLVSRNDMIWFWDHYLPDSARRTDPDASPLRAADLSGLPPAVVLTAEHDVLRDEGHAYVARLRDAGVPVEHRCFSGQLHGFFTMRNVLPGSDDGLAFVADQVARRLAVLSDVTTGNAHA